MNVIRGRAKLLCDSGRHHVRQQGEKIVE